ncbi:pilus assembly protein CpaE [Actinotalea sp. M2MS4P-6]|uniref:pilus assembly protein CpaE n=1 Tax=Actinotalea sp. M2MS4P-6 TaxID=2983762 RepID=UPI0021E40849|nr:pilus assembly protein CpaE [Actinotalea sp. M2MS4P-6]MCV2394049.1 pilus assembly protein CpaE [Actinotalea sp. M2MS4P-6]
MEISEHRAAALRDAGLHWTPAPGDRFVIPQPDLVGEVFTLSEMTIEAHHYPTGTILGFNGTTEWALDSVAQEDVLWLPREDQLRELLGGAFVALTRGARAEWVVTTRLPDADPVDFAAPTAADAYGDALLALMRHVGAPV